MWEQTKLEDFVDGELEVRVARLQPPRKSTFEQILERLEKIETMLHSGHVTASVGVSRPALAGGSPIIRKYRKSHTFASELRELMNIDDDSILLGTPKEILAALRNRE